MTHTVYVTYDASATFIDDVVGYDGEGDVVTDRRIEKCARRKCIGCDVMFGSNGKWIRSLQFEFSSRPKAERRARAIKHGVIAPNLKVELS